MQNSDNPKSEEAEKNWKAAFFPPYLKLNQIDGIFKVSGQSK